MRVWLLDPATRMNPHLTFGQVIPGINRDAASASSRRPALPDMLDGIVLISSSPAWTRADEDGLQAGCAGISRGSSRARTVRRSRRTATTTRPGTTCRSRDWRSTADRLTGHAGRSKAHAPASPPDRTRRSPATEPNAPARRDYSEFNLAALMDLATLGTRVAIDLWNYRTADGRSIRQALDFMVPYAAAERKWTWIKSPRSAPARFTGICARRAAGRSRRQGLAERIGGGGPRLILTAP